MENDDFPTGYVLNRRDLLGLLGTAGLLAWARPARALPLLAAPLTTCIVRPALTEGPYFVDEGLNRSDIRSDPGDNSVRPGTPLELTFNVGALVSGVCVPLVGARVDIWHCDHLGVYSDATDPGFNTVGKKFLRGYQVTDESGPARFSTIYPGWYPGRTVHIHFKIRSAPATAPGYAFTSQLFFDDALTDQAYTVAPYAGRGARAVRNGGDGIYNQAGSQLLLSLTGTTSGYAAAFDVALAGVTPARPGTWSRIKGRRS